MAHEYVHLLDVLQLSSQVFENLLGFRQTGPEMNVVLKSFESKINMFRRQLKSSKEMRCSRKAAVGPI